MQYLTAEEVAQINASITEARLLVDPGLLASAVGRPAQTVFGEDAYPTLFLKAAALFESLACNHAFIDGNKRTAVVATIQLLNWNGYDVRAEQEDIVDVAVRCATHEWDLHKVAEFLEAHAIPIDYPDISNDERQSD